MTVFALAWINLLILASSGSAQTIDIPSLMAVKSLRCAFPSVAQASNWTGREPAPIVKKQDWGFEITAIDMSKGVARITGEYGSTDLVVIRGVDVVTFIERSVMGNVLVTSVFASRDNAGRFQSVHSRHLHELPSQDYGYCAQR